MAARVFRGFLFPRLPLWKNRGLQASQVVLHADTCHRERFPMSGSYRFIHNSRAVLSSDLESKIQEMPIAQGSWLMEKMGTFFPHEKIQSYFEFIHSCGIPWWETIAIGIISIRIVTLPLSILQLRAGYRYKLANKEKQEIYKLLWSANKRLGRNASWNERLKLYMTANQGIKVINRKYKCQLFRLFGSTLLNFYTILSFTYTTRKMINFGVPGLDTGGTELYPNLQESDPSFLLPIVTVALTLLLTEMALNKTAISRTILTYGLTLDQTTSNKNEKVIKAGQFLEKYFLQPDDKDKNLIQKIFDKFRVGLQLSVLVFAPYYAELPVGVFCTWIPSVLFSICYTLAIQKPKVQDLIGAPIYNNSPIFFKDFPIVNELPEPIPPSSDPSKTQSKVTK